MLDLLPLPKPDELLYSIFARFALRMQLPNRRDLLNLLFGRSTGTSVTALSTSLDAFQLRVPPWHPLHDSNLLEELTLFPVYAPFMESQRVDELQADMKGAGGSCASLRAGIMAHRMPRRGLQACPKCIAEDLSQDGEPFWRRSHQVHGVLVCNHHKTFLIETAVAATPRVNRQEFLMPSDSIAAQMPRELSLNQQEHQDFLRLAQYAQMVLAQRGWRMTTTSWVEWYRRCLADRGYASGEQYCETSRLVADFSARFASEFLRQVGCDSPQAAKDPWLARLIRRPRVSRPALHHFLLWLFLDVSPDDILRRSKTDSSSQAKLPIGLKGSKRPERSPEWNEHLRRLWDDRKLSLRKIARELEVDPITVKRHAVKLGLSFPRSFVRPTTTAGVDLMIQRRQDQIACLKSRKEAWLRLQAEHPEMGAKKLRYLDPRLYAALYRADRTWLKGHQPKRERIHRASRVDWQARDSALQEQLKTAYITLTVSRERPMQITLAALGRKVGARALLEKHLDKLPKCQRFVQEVSENRVQYALRRLGYAAAMMRRTAVTPIAWRLLIEAGIRADLAKNQVIVDYVEELVRGSSRVRSSATAGEESEQERKKVEKSKSPRNALPYR